jgi:hypothetical protein
VTAVIKMQTVMDDARVACEKKYNAVKLHEAVDDFLSGKLQMRRGADGFYYGDGSGKDFSRFGLAFNTLRKKDWFLDNVDTWPYFNSDASDDPEDFAVEDMKDYCKNHMLVIV